MKKVLMLTLAIEVEDLPDTEREGIAIKDMGFDSVDEAELGSLKDYKAACIAKQIRYAIDDKDWQAEFIWAGSEMYARFGKIEITEAKWKA